MAEETRTEGYTDAEAMFVAKKKATSETSQKKALPQFFIKKDKLEVIEVEVVFNPISGELLSVTRPGLFDEGVLAGLGVEVYEFRFAPVTFSQMIFYRRQSSQLHPQTGESFIDKNRMRSFLLFNHLRETNILDEDGSPITLKFDEKTSSLSPESLQLLERVSPVLLDVVLELFEKKTAVVR